MGGSFKVILVFVVLLLALVAAMAYLHEGGVGSRVYTVGIVNPSKGMKGATQGFIKGLEQHGYVAGKNITYLKWETRKGLDKAIGDMIAKGVDLLYTVTTPATIAAKQATAESGIPVVFTMYDPVKSKVIDSLAKPGGNLTGVQVAGSIERGMDWLRTVVPSVKKIFVPVKYDTMAAKQSLAELEAYAQRLGVQLVVVEVQDEQGLVQALDAMPADADAIFLPHSILLTANTPLLVEIAADRKIPLLKSHRDKRVTLSSGHNEYNTGVQASRMAHMLLHGESPENVPSEIAEFYVTINLQHIKAIGVDVTNDILLKADEIIR